MSKRRAEARSNAVWGSGKIAGGVAVIAATMALIAPGVASAYVLPPRIAPVIVSLPPPIAPVEAPAPTVAPVLAAVSWGDVSWGDGL
ncbi:MAG: hypothetical protein M3R70_05455 [Actinomycetota bacterium]|nr:hypothetical protein [Actinomycetota bacterium]